MFKNIVKKSVSAVVALGMALSVFSLVPVFASANNGLGLGLGHKLDLDIKNDAFVSANKTASTTLRDSIKEAKKTYKAAKKTATVQYKASVKIATNQTEREAALKTYFLSILAAFKAKSGSIETALQAFIDARFNQNQAPVANSQNITVSKNSSVNITLTGSDPEGSALTYTVVTSTTHGTLSGTAPNLVYTPTANFTGTDSFTFKVSDGSLNSTSKTVSITVNP